MIIGFCGTIGSGKDTAANFLVNTHGFVKLSFGAVLKDVVAAIFGWSRELLEGDTIESRNWRNQEDQWWTQRLEIGPITPRRMLQHIGTDLFRHEFHQDIWTACIERRISELMKQQKHIVVTDCRFPNEVECIHKYNGKVYKISRRSSAAIDLQNAHISEQTVEDCKVDDEIDNRSDLQNLYVQLSKLL